MEINGYGILDTTVKLDDLVKHDQRWRVKFSTHKFPGFTINEHENIVLYHGLMNSRSSVDPEVVNSLAYQVISTSAYCCLPLPEHLRPPKRQEEPKIYLREAI